MVIGAVVYVSLAAERGGEEGFPHNANARQPGNVEAGRNVFNGNGICYYCHGVDGYRERIPELAPDTAAIISRLNPEPADLRNPTTLRLTTDKERARAIREGHPGTGMFPDSTLKDAEIEDVLAYLAELRREGTARKSHPSE